MESVLAFIDIFLHVDRHLAALVNEYGATYLYVILFLVIFAETGLVVTPILPGDSLLFAIGALCAAGVLSIAVIIPLLILAALCGDLTNYTVGHAVGPAFLEKRAGKGMFRLVKPEYLTRTQEFYARHGGKTIIMARFVPIVRTFAPFVAGLGRMPVTRYATFCVSGAVLWIVTMSTSGYVFGNIPWVKDNFSVVVLAIVGISVLPMVFEAIKARRAATAAKA